MRAAVEAAAAVFAAAGREVEPLGPFMTPRMLADLDEFWRVRSLTDLDALDPAGPGPGAALHPAVGRSPCATSTASSVMRDYASIMALQQATVAATETFDLVLSPVAPMTAFPAEWPMPWGEDDEAMAHIGFTVPYNMSGQPAGTIELRLHRRRAHDRPAGLRVAGSTTSGCSAPLAWFERHRRRARPRVADPRS